MKSRRNGRDKPAIISIKGEQQPALDDEIEVVEFVTSGSYRIKDGICHIKYNESSLTGMEGTKTHVSVEDGKVTIVRSGYISSQMTFEKGQKHLSLYETPAGSFTVGVNAFKIDSSFDENGGSLTVDYSIEIDNTIAGYNNFSIIVKSENKTAKDLTQ
jgi:uncharacterized beta-barrel protein YwiB (DUF1934 family)